MELSHPYLPVSHSLSSFLSFLPTSSLGATPLLVVLPTLFDLSLQSLLMSPLVVVSVLPILYHFLK